MLRKNVTRWMAMVIALIVAVSIVGIPSFAADGSYIPGEYQGSAQGRNGSVPVTVTVGSDGKISAVTVGANSETASYLENAKAVIPQIISLQTTESVDVVAGATKSSQAIISASKAALDRATATGSPFAVGSGSADSPYMIASATELVAFASAVNGGETYAGKHVKLATDISLTQEWTPIGTQTVNFSGIFDGAGHSISGISIGSQSAPSTIANGGLFAVIGKTAKVLNLNLADVSIYLQGDDRPRAGALAAQTEAGSEADGGTIIDNCRASGTMVSAKSTADTISYAGGLIAHPGTYSVVTNSGADIDVVSQSAGSRAPYAGGLYGVGGNNSLTANCYALGDVNALTVHTNAATGVCAAGLIGMQSGKVYNSYAAGNVAVTGIAATNTATQFTAVAALSGQLIKTTGGMNTVYYRSDAQITVNGTAQSPVKACGVATPTASKDPENAISHTATEMASMVLVNELNTGARNVATADIEVNPTNPRQAVALPDGISLHDWEIKDGAVVPKLSAAQGGGGDGGVGDLFESGNGNADNPYIIKTEAQLRAFATSLTEEFDYQDASIKLDNDIVISAGNWIPIGEGEYAFAGSFDGNNHSISGIKYDNSASVSDDNLFAGFVGVLHGSVKNLTLTDVNIKAVGKKAVYAGAVCGYIDVQTALIDSVRADGKVYAETTETGNNFAGGIVGSNLRGTIVNTGADVDVSSIQRGGYWAEVGGIAAMNNRGLILNCYSLGDIYANARRDLEAGIAASNIAGFQAGTMINCYASGSLETSDWAQAVGAVAGNTTGIGKGYFLYYNKEASQNIGGQHPNPIATVGITVKTPDEDNPSVIISGFNHELKGQTAAFMRAGEMAALLNGNLAKFPMELPDAVKLKTWEMDGSIARPIGSIAQTVYIPVVVIDDTPPAYFAGTYMGRNADKTCVVKVKTSADAVLSIEPVTPKAVAGSAEIISQIKENPNSIGSLQPATPELTALKNAIEVALKKAKIGDMTGYGTADPSKIFASGTGTEQKPYQIASEAQLRAFAAAINEDEGFSGKYVSITKDITLSQEWTPAGGGQGTHAFSGILLGNGWTIKNMRIGSAASPSGYRFAGLLGYGDGIKVKDVHLTDVSINNVYTGVERAFSGALIGGVDEMSWIDGCTASGSISSITTGPQACFVGGLTAFTSGYGNVETGDPENSYSVTITNSGTNVVIYGQSHNGWVYAGGVAGNTNRTYIVNCWSLGDITVFSGNDEKQNINRAAAGGIAGFSAGKVSNCYASGTMKSLTASTDVGGYAGRHTGIAITEYVYYNEDAAHMSGDTVLDPTPGVGYTVPASTGKAPNPKARSLAELRASSFADILNANRAKLAVKTPGSVPLKTWSYDKAVNAVVAAQPNVLTPIVPPPPKNGFEKQKDGTWKYFKNDKPVTGWQNIAASNGKTYRYHFGLDGVMHTGWQAIVGSNGKTYRYHFGSDGIMRIGWQNIAGSNGKAYRYHFGSDGVMRTGWQNIKQANGKTYRYYFGKSASDGKMRTGWQNIKQANGKTYRYYFGKSANDGKMRTGWQNIKQANGKTYRYYFGKSASDGKMRTGWQNIKRTNGKTYRYYFGKFASDGKMRTGKHTISGVKRTFSKTGILIR